ncbi:MAG: DUF1292 domain-containing protein [Ruminococcaceae bacterium]|nr:DUF1292 domain-containing protein [Oscillospiraceae bacterium]
MSEQNYNPNEEIETIMLDFDNGEECECAPVCIFEADGKEYIGLIPVDCPEGEEEVYIYRFSEDEDGNSVIENIENDEEYDAAADAFDAWLEAQAE